MAKKLQVRNADDDLVLCLEHQAARNGRSTEAEHRDVLRQALLSESEPSFAKLAAELRRLTRLPTPAEELQREGRNER